MLTMTDVEIACGWIFGVEKGVPPLPQPVPGTSAREALDDVVISALRRPPCVVSFSGGRDSSVVLAVAVAAARAHGLPLPIPVTLRFPAAPVTDEGEWQELVVRHLGLSEWDRITFSDELDCVGPFAQDILRRHGVVWPMNSHFQMPIQERARGGSVLTGVGGDEVFSTTRWHRAAAVVKGAEPARMADLGRVALAFGPFSIRYAYLRARGQTGWDAAWLRPDLRRWYQRRLAYEHAREPVWWGDVMRDCWWPTRYRVLTESTLAVLGREKDVMVLNPFTAPAFLAQAMFEAGPLGYGNRTLAFTRLAGDVLPRQLIHRTSKSSFNPVFYNRYTQEFARQWDGKGLDGTIVNVQYLKDAWSDADSSAPPLTSALLQSAWCAQHSSDTVD